MKNTAVKVLAPKRVIETFTNMKTALERIDSEVKLHHYKIRNYQPNITFKVERGNYILKTAESGAELEECLKLRFEVFHKEFMNKKRNIGIDIDKMDYICDHLAIIDKKSNRVIGTYRLNSSKFTDSFYSTSEFNLVEILKLEGTKLELGRACIDKDHRNGVVITMLWRGISEYITQTDTRYMFGCASVKTMEPLEIGLVTKFLNDEGYTTGEYGVSPTRKYKVKQLTTVLDYIEKNPFEYDRETVQKLIPALFKSYMKAGAKLCGEPALDRDFHCIDFLTLMDVGRMNAAHKAKYLKPDDAAPAKLTD